MILAAEELKPALLLMREELRAKVAHFKTTQALDGTGYTNHQADDATQAFDQAKDHSILRGSERRLRLVEDALAKLDIGSYGTCEHCAKTIDLARLEAIPYTQLCLACAEKRDYTR
ncbi:TraR/DksA family transcriptional regulator [Chloroflexota bacterium]